MIEAIGDEYFGYIPYALTFMLGQLDRFEPQLIINSFKDSLKLDIYGETDEKLSLIHI